MTTTIITPFTDATVTTPSDSGATASPIIISKIPTDANDENTFEELFEKEVALRDDAITTVLDGIISAKESIKTSVNDLKAALT